MKIEEILIEVRKLSKNGIPNASDKRLYRVVKEAERKIGSWRKTLWLSGVIQDQRQSQLPRCLFKTNRGEMQLYHPSGLMTLQHLFRKYP